MTPSFLWDGLQQYKTRRHYFPCVLTRLEPDCYKAVTLGKEKAKCYIATHYGYS